jgi:hypothetical protein
MDYYHKSVLSVEYWFVVEKGRSSTMRTAVYIVVAAGALLSGLVPQACAEVLTFDASDDTFLLPASSGTRNGGGNDVIAAGPNSSTAGVVYRSLIRFDVSALSGQSGVIDEATLTFTHAGLTKLAAARQQSDLHAAAVRQPDCRQLDQQRQLCTNLRRAGQRFRGCDQSVPDR